MSSWAATVKASSHARMADTTKYIIHHYMRASLTTQVQFISDKRNKKESSQGIYKSLLSKGTPKSRALPTVYHKSEVQPPWTPRFTVPRKFEPFNFQINSICSQAWALSLPMYAARPQNLRFLECAGGSQLLPTINGLHSGPSRGLSLFGPKAWCRGHCFRTMLRLLFTDVLGKTWDSSYLTLVKPYQL